jgi:hypothetical protein
LRKWSEEIKLKGSAVYEIPKTKACSYRVAVERVLCSREDFIARPEATAGRPEQPSEVGFIVLNIYGRRPFFEVRERRLLFLNRWKDADLTETFRYNDLPAAPAYYGPFEPGIDVAFPLSGEEQRQLIDLVSVPLLRRLTQLGEALKPNTAEAKLRMIERLRNSSGDGVLVRAAELATKALQRHK